MKNPVPDREFAKFPATYVQYAAKMHANRWFNAVYALYQHGWSWDRIQATIDACIEKKGEGPWAREIFLLADEQQVLGDLRQYLPDFLSPDKQGTLGGTGSSDGDSG